MSKWRIRTKLLFGLCLLLVLVATLAFSGFRGVYAYRSLVRGLSARSSELPRAAALSTLLADLRMTVGEIHGYRQAQKAAATSGGLSELESRFAAQLVGIENSLATYRNQLGSSERTESRLSDSSREQQTVQRITTRLSKLSRLSAPSGWADDDGKLTTVASEVMQLHTLVDELPSFLYEEIHSLYHEVRAQYRTWIVLQWVTSVLGATLLLLLVKLSYDWVIQPLRLIIRGSRQVASGEFSYRIRLSSHDEMRELADAMNAMTARFQETRDDLDRQVAERTKQVIRSEQLASVGFLAAGVAHEINNPLASIALCAESLESRIHEALSAGANASEADRNVIQQYLKLIHSEAFRCKGITERLLDFSRRGESQRQLINLCDLVSGVIEMVGHIGKYHDMHIEFVPGEAVIAPVNAQEIKQVVLNLLTNGLESLAPGGTVRVEIRKHAGSAQILFTDNGCGMTSEVKEHLFEPFFTRRRAGQGVGLGLSITYRIVADHQGHIDVQSDGPDRGSRFTVQLPLNPSVALPRPDELKEVRHRHQAA